MRVPGALLLLAAVALLPCRSAAQSGTEAAGSTHVADPDSARWSSFLPFLKEEATKRGIELPLPFGAGLVYYHLSRDIAISDVRVGLNGAPLQSVSDFAQLSSRTTVENVNLKLDAWLLPFLNVYLIAGYLWNNSDTRLEVTLPPLLPGGSTRRREITLPTRLTGTVGGVGLTMAGGYGPYFLTYDVNVAQADLGFDDRFKAVLASFRGGWNGKAGSRPLRTWLSVTDWNTFATATGTVADPDGGGTLSFEADQGPVYRYTYGLGAQYGATRWLELAADTGVDFHGGWYLALVPVLRF